MFSPSAVGTYARIVFANPPDGGLIALRGLPEKGRNTAPHLVWVNPKSPQWIDAVAAFVRDCDRLGLAAYCIPGFVNGRRAGSGDVMALPTILVDIDSGDIAAKAERATRILGTPSLAVHSGGRIEGQPKTHLYWALSGDTAAARVGKLRGQLASYIGADLMFGPGREHQPIRIAGSVHRKAAPVPVEIAYESVNVLDVAEAERRLASLGHANPHISNGGPALDDPAPNGLGLFRQVSMDELPTRFIGHGEPDINRFEALTRMAGMMLSNIHDIDDQDACNREYGYYRDWCSTHIENVHRDYDIATHWKRLLRRERWKRQQPRRPRARPMYMRRG